ncbi:unnamed protein product [Parnassius mnemosyne]|uniref:Transposase n=1 Tax=Parnassius mnemosyne TaxID=213953 RepID=A0AAV1KWE2_9NEOP
MAPKKNYTPEQMRRAIEAVKRGEAVSAAASKYGVPRITLRNKVTGISPAVCSMGPGTIFTVQEEQILVKWLFALADRHFPISREQLLDSVQQIIIKDNRKTPFTNNRPGKTWYQAFLKRHPEISERTAQNLITSRDNVTEQQIKSWFTEIKNYLQEQNLEHLLKRPSRIFNADESAFFLSPKSSRVLVRRGDKTVYTTSGNEKENLTVLLTANAAGQIAPPMIVFAYERVPKPISDSVPDTWGIGRSESGWMCSETFYEYFTNIFHPWLIEKNIELPVLFFLDGHGSHLTTHLSDFCAKNGIELIALYPNSTHILQPMDVAVFRPLKVFWKRQVIRWKTEHLGQQVSKTSFAPILKSALDEITKDCISNGFRAGGICPFGPEYIDFSKLNSKNRSAEITKAQGASSQNVKFLRMLEPEIVTLFSDEKLNTFKKYFFPRRTDLENELPAEDIGLYMLWAKYKHLCHIEFPPQSTSEEIDLQSIETTATQTTYYANNHESEVLLNEFSPYSGQLKCCLLKYR